MPTSPSHKLSQRFSKYLGLNERTVWGRRAADLGIEALRGHSPIAVSGLNFGEIAISNATAFAATPLNATVTAPGTGSPTIVCNSSNGYLTINNGTTADLGYSIQWNVADVPNSMMQFLASPNLTISVTRDIYFGVRCAFVGETNTWDGKVFMGLAPTDTALLTVADGTITQSTMDQGVGWHIGEGGTISLVCSETTGNSISTSAVTNPTMNVRYPDATNGSFMTHSSPTTVTAAHFHDYFFHAHWGSTDATSAASFVEGYLDGKLVASITGAAKLPNLTAGDLFCTFESLNGGTRDCDVLVSEIMVAAPRYHIA